MSRTSLISRAVLTSAAAALVLAGCSTGGDDAEFLPATGIEAPAAPGVPAAPEAPAAPESRTASPSPSASEAASGDGASAGGPARPSRGRCVDIPEAPDGVYQVFDAGTVTVIREGNRLVLVSQEAAPGWTSRIDDLDRDEVEIEFRRGSEELEIEIELDDGRVDVEICNDDD